MRVLCHMGAESSRKRLLFSVLVGFERRVSNGVKRVFFIEAAMKNGGTVLGTQNAARCGTAEPVRNSVNRTENEGIYRKNDFLTR